MGKGLGLSMGWYSAKLPFESKVNDERQEAPLCEESIRVLLASDDDEALEKATRIGLDAAHDYKNEENNDVSWQFVRVLEIQDLVEDRLDEGSEVFSRLFWRSESLEDFGMTQRWQTDILNDPLRDFQLCVEISDADRVVGSIFRAESGELVLRLFPGGDGVDFPAHWLADLLQSVEEDLPRQSA